MIETQNESTKSPYFVYEDLIKNYKTALVDNLRGFGLGKDILELWVPNEDICKSISDLLFAAKSNNAEVIRLSISRKNITPIGEDQIRQMLIKNYPRYEFHSDDNRIFLEVFGLSSHINDKLREKRLIDRTVHHLTLKRVEENLLNNDERLTQPEDIHSIYHQKIFSIPFKKELKKENLESIVLESELDGLFFKVVVHSNTGIVLSANYSGSRTKIATAISEILCNSIVGLPILEIANHGTIRLESYLRDDLSESKRPIKGIMIPEKTDRAFLFFKKILQQVLRNYKERFNDTAVNSNYDDSPSDNWLKSSEKERFEILNSFFSKLNFIHEKIEVVAIEYDVRIVIDLPTANGEILLKLEKHLKKEVDSRLELFLAEIQDKNKLRTHRLLKIGDKP